MAVAKIAISIDPQTLSSIDALILENQFQSRSELFQTAVTAQLDRLDESALAHECSKLDPKEEQAFAEAGLSSDLSTWPAY